MALPSGYKRLEYIQSSGEEFINTTFYANNNTRVVMDFQITEAPENQGIFGARTASGNNAYCFLYHVTNKYFRADYNTLLSQTWASDWSARYTVDCNKGSTTFDGTTKSYTNSTFTCEYPLYLFAWNNKGLASLKCTMRLYYCKIYDNGALIRDYIPCENESGEVGLWDDVNGVFYKNAGTGTFTGGPVYDQTAPVGDHNTNIGQVAREIEGGTVLNVGVGQEIESGLVLVGGVAREIVFSKPLTVEITAAGDPTYCWMTIDGTVYTEVQTIEVEAGATATFYSYSAYNTRHSITLDGTRVATSTALGRINYDMEIEQDIEVEFSTYSPYGGVKKGDVAITTL